MQKASVAAHEQGIFHRQDLMARGVSATQLRRLLSNGEIIRIGRGLYTHADYDATEFHSLVAAIQAQSNGVICLLSALSFHGIGTQLPHQVWVSVPYGARISMRVPTMRVVVVRRPAYDAGIEIHHLEGVNVPVYRLAKTVADCFKFRNKIGLDVAIEALREVLRERLCSRGDIHMYARIDRVETVMRPYLEAFSA